MDHRKVHDSIIQRARLRGLDKSVLEGYYERHHVVPRCLGGGNEAGNLVLLTAKEHFLVHALLCHIHAGNKSLLCAFANLCGKVSRRGQERYATGQEYSKLRGEYARMVGERSRGNQYAAGTKRTEEHRAALSRLHKGKSISLAQRQAIAESNRRRKKAHDGSSSSGANGPS
jgi:hypothetical protein